MSFPDAKSRLTSKLYKLLLLIEAVVLVVVYSILNLWIQDYSGMPTTLREAVAYGSTDVTSFITQHCNKASEKVRSTLTKQAYLRI